MSWSFLFDRDKAEAERPRWGFLFGDPPEDPLEEERKRKLRQIEEDRRRGDEQWAEINTPRTLYDQPLPESLENPVVRALGQTGAEVLTAPVRFGAGVVEGYGGATRAVGEQVGSDWLANQGDVSASTQRGLREYLTPPEVDVWGKPKRYASAALENVPQLGWLAATRGLAGLGGLSSKAASILGLGMMGVQAGGQEYQEAREGGATPEEAGTSAMFTGAGEALSEGFGTLPLVKRLGGEGGKFVTSGARAAAEAARQAFMEGPVEETAATLSGRLGKALSYSDFARQFGPGSGLGAELEEGAVVGAVVGGGGSLAASSPQVKVSSRLTPAQREIAARISPEQFSQTQRMGLDEDGLVRYIQNLERLERAKDEPFGSGDQVMADLGVDMALRRGPEHFAELNAMLQGDRAARNAERPEPVTMSPEAAYLSAELARGVREGRAERRATKLAGQRADVGQAVAQQALDRQARNAELERGRRELAPFASEAVGARVAARLRGEAAPPLPGPPKASSFPDAATVRQQWMETHEREHPGSVAKLLKSGRIVDEDAVTGFLPSSEERPTVRRAQEHTARTGEGAVFVSMDLQNLGGANAAWGRDQVDVIYRENMRKVVEGLKQAFPGASLSPFRSTGAGDETSAVLVAPGLTPQAVGEAMHQVAEAIQQAALAEGRAVPNPKKGGAVEPIGVHFGIAEIVPGIDDRKVTGIANLLVEKYKRGDHVYGKSARAGRSAPPPVSAVGVAGGVAAPGGGVRAAGPGGEGAGQAPAPGDAPGAGLVPPVDAPDRPAATEGESAGLADLAAALKVRSQRLGSGAYVATSPDFPGISVPVTRGQDRMTVLAALRAKATEAAPGAPTPDSPAPPTPQAPGPSRTIEATEEEFRRHLDVVGLAPEEIDEEVDQARVQAAEEGLPLPQYFGRLIAPDDVTDAPPPDRLSLGTFRRQLVDSVGEAEADSVLQLVAARAAKVGESVDDFVGQRLAGVEMFEGEPPIVPDALYQREKARVSDAGKRAHARAVRRKASIELSPEENALLDAHPNQKMAGDVRGRLLFVRAKLSGPRWQPVELRQTSGGNLTLVPAGGGWSFGKGLRGAEQIKDAGVKLGRLAARELKRVVDLASGAPDAPRSITIDGATIAAADAQNIKEAADWYSALPNRFRERLGGFFDAFVEVLAATSPQNVVKTNWGDAKGVLNGMLSGRFDKALKEFGDFIAAGGDPGKYQGEQIRKLSGKLFGTNSNLAARALLQTFYDLRPGMSPKTRAFARNMRGDSSVTTVDKWNARTWQRKSGGQLIPPAAEPWVPGEYGQTMEIGGGYGVGNAANFEVARLISQVMGKDVDGASAQAMLWFLEKTIWAKNGWSYQDQDGSFLVELETDDFDRMSAGLSQAVYGEPKPARDAQWSLARSLQAAITAMPGVLFGKAQPTLGMYGKSVERSIDVEVVVPGGASFDTESLWQKIVQSAKTARQDSTFITRVIPEAEENGSDELLPALEISFRRPLTPLQAHTVVNALAKRGVLGMTLVVDPRTQEGTAGPMVIGMRHQVIPEFSALFGEEAAAQALLDPQGYDALVQSEGAKLKALLPDILVMFPDAVASARKVLTRVAFKEDYDAELAARGSRGVHQGPGGSWAGWNGGRASAARAAARRLGVPTPGWAQPGANPGDDGSGTLLQRGRQDGVIRGATRFLEDGRAIVQLSQKHKDPSTLAHEIFHVFRRTMTAEEDARARKEFGAGQGWTVEAEEKFANAGVAFLRRGEAPNPNLADLFTRFRDWLSKVYRKLAGTELEGALSPAGRLFFMQFFAAPGVYRGPQPIVATPVTTESLSIVPGQRLPPPPTDAVRKWVKKWLTREGMLPPGVHALWEKKQGAIEAERLAIQRLGNAFRARLKRHMKAAGLIYDDQARADMFDALNAILDGQTHPAQSQLPEDLKRLARKMRGKIDELQGRLTASDMLTDEQKQQITDSVGTWVTRAYAVFDDPKWLEKLRSTTRWGDMIPRAQQLLASEAEEDLRKAITQAMSAGVRTGAIAPDQVQQLAHQATAAAMRYVTGADPQLGPAPPKVKQVAEQWKRNLTPEAVEAWMERVATFREAPLGDFGSGLGTELHGILMHRQDVPDVVRELMGEYGDPAVRFMLSATRIARTVDTYEMYKSIKQLGEQAGWITSKQAPVAGLNRQIGGTLSKSPLGGMFTSEEIAEAISESYSGAERGWLKALRWFTGAVKANKTVYSPTGQARNFLSNMLLLLGSGNMGNGLLLPGSKHPTAPRGLASAIRAYAAARSSSLAKMAASDPGFERRTDEELLGIVKRAVQLGAVSQNVDVRDIRGFLGQTEKMLIDPDFLGSVQETAETAYQFSDDVYKLATFINETARHLWVHPNATLAEAEQIAADNTKNVLPNYDRQIRLIKEFRQLPLVGGFIGFVSEIPRNAANIARLAYQDIAEGGKSGNKRQVYSGIQRGACLTVSLGANVTAAMLLSVIKEALGGDDDKQLEEDIARFVPPWMKNSRLLVWRSDGHGQFGVWDMSQLDPWATLYRPINAILRDGEVDDSALEKTGRAFLEAIGPYFTLSPGIAPFIEAAFFNRTQQGVPVVIPGRSVSENAQRVALHFFRGWAPQFMLSAHRISKAASGEGEEWGKVYRLGNEVLSLFGPRLFDVDINKTLEFEAKRYRYSPKDDARALSTASEKMYELVAAAQRLGLKPERIALTLRSAGISAQDARAFLSGQQATEAWLSYKDKQRQYRKENAP